ncbi:hypothetical protein V2G26_000528 [Clonostachys chloroleuca]
MGRHTHPPMPNPTLHLLSSIRSYAAWSSRQWFFYYYSIFFTAYISFSPSFSSSSCNARVEGGHFDDPHVLLRSHILFPSVHGRDWQRRGAGHLVFFFFLFDTFMLATVLSCLLEFLDG